MFKLFIIPFTVTSMIAAISIITAKDHVQTYKKKISYNKPPSTFCLHIDLLYILMRQGLCDLWSTILKLLKGQHGA